MGSDDESVLSSSSPNSTSSVSSAGSEDEPRIDGSEVVTTVLRSKGRATGCEMCGFSDWDYGDVKYIVEHWQNSDSSHGAREHLCPPCAVSRGLSNKYFHQNKNAPVNLHPNTIKVLPTTKAYLMDKIPPCEVCKSTEKRVETTTHSMGGVIECRSNDGGKNQIICLSCALSKGLLNIPDADRKRNIHHDSINIETENQPLENQDHESFPHASKKVAR